MKLKQRPGDFRVEEVLAPGYVQPSGPHRIYRVRKRKLTSLEAAAALAREARVDAADVALAGLKDRQGITVQFMSVLGGRSVEVHSPELDIEPVGFAAEPVGPGSSRGNRFEITVRALTSAQAAVIERRGPEVARWGFPNYFDEQRFGNLTHGQGWIFADLLRGRTEKALERLLVGASSASGQRERRFRRALGRAWGDWRACREIAGKLGAHHSVFEHLMRSPDDFAGAFGRVARRLRLIHLYAYQSHLWNRAVVRYLRSTAPRTRWLSVRGIEGWLAFYAAEPNPAWRAATFRLPGPRLEDVDDAAQRAALAAALADDGFRPQDLSVEGVRGFQLKGEDRELIVRPRELRASSPSPDRENRGRSAVRVEFQLGRGSYATLVVKRLLAGVPGAAGAGDGAGSRGGAGRSSGERRRPGPHGSGKRGASSDGRGANRYAAPPTEHRSRGRRSGRGSG